MTTIFGNGLLLLIFSLALAIVVSGYRDDDPPKVVRGIWRRGLKFSGAVIGVALVSWALSLMLS